jgi:hypothetical protein
MREIRVVNIDPFAESDFKIERIIPLVAPDDIFPAYRQADLMVRITRSVSELPLGFDHVVNICLSPKVEQLHMRRKEVG